jgi:hypothetical protein
MGVLKSFSKKGGKKIPVDEAIRGANEIWDDENLTYDAAEKQVIVYLREILKSGDIRAREWARKELDQILGSKKTSREEAKMEDASKGTDPDALTSEEDLRAEIEYESDYRRDGGYLD